MSLTKRDLVYAATSRCRCGAGLAHQRGIGIGGCWDCSAVLLGTADANSAHDAGYPFAFYEVKSENQPSAQGATTRPIPLTPEEREMLAVHKAGLKRSVEDVRVVDVLLRGLQTDGAQHKQWALWRIAEIMHLTHFLSDVEDKGVAP